MAERVDQYLAPGFVQTLAWIVILGSIALVAGNVVGSIVVPDHDFVADTVSDLAAGRYEIIQDVALYGFAASLFALALACAHLHGGRTTFSVLTFALALLALCVIVIGARNEYGDGDNEGIVVHIYVVYALGALFALAFVLMALEGGRIAPFLTPVSWVCFGLWAVGAPIFFLMPTEWDGLWERGLGVICVVWAIAVAQGLRRFCAQEAQQAA